MILEGAFTCRKSDIRHLRIKCRCGNIFIAEVPIQVADATTLHPCPGCGQIFTAQMSPRHQWDIKRTDMNIRNATVALEQIEGPGKPSAFGIGTVVRIVDITKQAGVSGGANPHPEHVGKQGIITSIRNIEGTLSPVITLQDGSVVGGWECWWEEMDVKGGN